MNALVLRRRLIYIGAMVLLLIPLYFLGNPSVREADGSVIQEGGTLSQLRTAYNLGQSDLGEMDPASESMRLATLGQRGAAIAILWQRAEYYKREKYWDNLSATLNQIAILQPHFVKVWEFQAHNLSYNVSVEFDDYRQRYAWVKRGMNYLMQGSKYNKKRTEMPYELGWFFGNKFGISDEKVQFREMFRADEPFHEQMLTSANMDVLQRAGEGPDGRPDNWRVGALWYQRAYDMVVSMNARPAKNSMMFYRQKPTWDMKHAEAIQSEGYLGEPARLAWERSEKEWTEFGKMPIPTSWGTVISLNELDRANQDYADLKKEFEELCGVTFQNLVEERKAELSPEQIAANEKGELDRSYDEILLAERAKQIMAIAPLALAKETPKDTQIAAIQMANKLNAAEERIRRIESYRNQINFAYWEARCVAEQQDEALLARSNMYEADQLLDDGQLDEALDKYNIAWTNWSALFNKFPAMMVDDLAESVLDSIERYRRHLDEPDLPKDFPLKNFMEFRRLFDDNLADPNMMGVIADWPKRYPDRNFLDEMLKSAPPPMPPESENPYFDTLPPAPPLDGELDSQLAPSERKSPQLNFSDVTLGAPEPTLAPPSPAAGSAPPTTEPAAIEPEATKPESNQPAAILGEVNLPDAGEPPSPIAAPLPPDQGLKFPEAPSTSDARVDPTANSDPAVELDRRVALPDVGQPPAPGTP